MKNYIKGFLKGMGIVLGYVLVLSILETIFNVKIDETVLALTTTGISLLYTNYLVLKYHQSRGWILAVFLFSILIIPFLVGNVSRERVIS